MVASGQYRVAGSRHLEEGEIIGVGQDDGEWVRGDGDAAPPEKVQDALDLLGGQMELAPGKHLHVFRQDTLVRLRPRLRLIGSQKGEQPRSASALDPDPRSGLCSH